MPVLSFALFVVACGVRFAANSRIAVANHGSVQQNLIGESHKIDSKHGFPMLKICKPRIPDTCAGTPQGQRIPPLFRRPWQFILWGFSEGTRNRALSRFNHAGYDSDSSSSSSKLSFFSHVWCLEKLNFKRRSLVRSEGDFPPNPAKRM
jgi:hypothetical protein